MSTQTLSDAPSIPSQRTDSAADDATTRLGPDIGIDFGVESDAPSGRPEMTAEDLDAQSPAADLVRVYLNGIGKTALLTAAQEVELAKRIEAGVFAQHVIDNAAEDG